ncbi:MAG: hypothetical protein Q8P90_04455 [bacterium]|nr:hypothetical protein [bacterium]
MNTEEVVVTETTTKKNKNKEKVTKDTSTEAGTDSGTALIIETDQNLNGGNTETQSGTDAKETISASETGTTETSTASNTFSFDQVASKVDLNNPSWDLFLVGFFIVGALLYGLSLGKDRVIAIMVSIYMALAVVAALPDFMLNVKINESYTLQITAFLSVFVVLFFLLSRQAVLNSLSPSSEGKYWQVLLFSVLHVGLLVAVTMSFLPPEVLSKFSELTLFIFTNEWTYFGWIIAPVAAMIFVGRSGEEK